MTFAFLLLENINELSGKKTLFKTKLNDNIFLIIDQIKVSKVLLLIWHLQSLYEGSLAITFNYSPFKGTVDRILSEPILKELHFRFTIVPLKRTSKKPWGTHRHFFISFLYFHNLLLCLKLSSINPRVTFTQKII